MLTFKAIKCSNMDVGLVICCKMLVQQPKAAAQDAEEG
jgi:hypothetical protein